MKLALIGYGKMGKTIEEIALQRRHEIVLKIDITNQEEFTAENLAKADAAIEFTGPHSAYENVKKALSFGVPLVCGSTGWLDKMEEIKKNVTEKNGAFLYASNFSIGVNIFFELNKKLAALMAPHPDYEIAIKEIHHTQKKDAPSGTAITLAEQILERNNSKKRWVNENSDNVEDLEIISERIDPAAGTHSIKYSSTVDDIEIIHTAHSRKGFALGAVLAAEFINGKKGFFSMKDVLNF
ncbi:MAG: 4-hydroxy-tetrahydrodipicolinate reductase [Bacteroidetes bacterium]|nr:4-hydroxy-tetrahydrodipicolinate reductase [Bacteroidota bacterium]MBS1932066.1 4-hydroxy-tetrahydrodipicolinate reductase [Bacteroidota bacterium]